ncbi:Uncharacterized protein FWK35_00032045, partial [Aphis craccivora]
YKINCIYNRSIVRCLPKLFDIIFIYNRLSFLFRYPLSVFNRLSFTDMLTFTRVNRLSFSDMLFVIDFNHSLVYHIDTGDFYVDLTV